MKNSNAPTIINIQCLFNRYYSSRLEGIIYTLSDRTTFTETASTVSNFAEKASQLGPVAFHQFIDKQLMGKLCGYRAWYDTKEIVKDENGKCTDQRGAWRVQRCANKWRDNEECDERMPLFKSPEDAINFSREKFIKARLEEIEACKLNNISEKEEV